MKTLICKRALTKVFLAVAIAAPMSLAAQIDIPNINGIRDFDFGLACELTLKQGDKPSLVITGDEDAISELYFRTSVDRLTIRTHQRHQHKEDVKITLTVPEINELAISGVVDLYTPNTLNFDRMRVEVSGVADLNMKIKAQQFTLYASGVLDADLSGETKDLKLDISGTGSLDATELNTTNCKVDISGMGTAEVNATENLDASVSGMGKIGYTGHPRVYAHTSGFGRIRKL